MDADALSTDVLAVEVEGPAVHATIDRPDSRNAMNAAVVSSLLSVCDAVEDGDVRVLVVRGAGGTFCSGGDLAEMPVGEDPETVREGLTGLSTLIERLRDLPALTVAAVEGYCLAGGMGLAAACEFVVASESATFGTPEVNVGLFPAQAMAPIVRATQQKRGLELLFTGEFVDAREAHEIGLVTRLAPPGEFEAELDALVESLTANSPLAVEVGKEAYYEHREMDFDRALSYLREVITRIAASEATVEGVEAFLEDRDPEWRE